MQNIYWGVLIISIGLFSGQSLFLGDTSPLSFVFDGLGLFWVGKGVLALYKNRQPTDSSGNAA